MGDKPASFAGEDTRRILGGMLSDRVLPPGTSVKFHVFASELISPFFPEEGAAKNRVCREIGAERKKLYAREMRERVGVPARDFRFLVSVRIPPGYGKNKVTESVWEKHAEQARKFGANIAGVLSSAQLYPRDFPRGSLSSSFAKRSIPMRTGMTTLTISGAPAVPTTRARR